MTYVSYSLHLKSLNVNHRLILKYIHFLNQMNNQANTNNRIKTMGKKES